MIYLDLLDKDLFTIVIDYTSCNKILQVEIDSDRLNFLKENSSLDSEENILEDNCDMKKDVLNLDNKLVNDKNY